MAQIIVRLKCITNLHVGNGDVNYNIIDNEVEKDPLTGYPMINSSGVKGALREFFRENAPDLVDPLFGSDRKGNTTPGGLKILAAEMLAIPMRASKGQKPYYLASTQEALSRYEMLQDEFLGAHTTAAAGTSADKELEDITPDQVVNLEGVGEICLLPDEKFRTAALPVMARNCLEDGRSTNLWYEEIVPYESVFFFPVIGSDGLIEDFKNVINRQIIQFGGNASIGYGLCKVSIMEGTK